MFTEAFIEQVADAVAARVLSHIGSSTNEQKLLSVGDAAKYIGRTPKAVEHLISRGIIPVTKLDGRRQIDRTALDRLISDRTYYEI